uniref:Uncharacterized protein n=1 Tax=Anguilla anguilla TaxID=7936 RepID=A0A0E9S605_ANGAN
MMTSHGGFTKQEDQCGINALSLQSPQPKENFTGAGGLYRQKCTIHDNLMSVFHVYSHFDWWSSRSEF